MDKHMKRYLWETHDHSGEVNMGDMMSYMEDEDADPAYLSHIIQDEFKGEQQRYLKMKLWDKQFRTGLERG